MVSLTTPAARLRSAIESSDYSIRSLARALSERSDVRASEESVRRALTNKLAGTEAIGDYYARILENQLGLPDGELREPDFARALADAIQVLRRLDAGETMPAEDLLAMADATDDVARACRQMSGRFQRAAKSQQPDGS